MICSPPSSASFCYNEEPPLHLHLQHHFVTTNAIFPLELVWHAHCFPPPLLVAQALGLSPSDSNLNTGSNTPVLLWLHPTAHIMSAVQYPGAHCHSCSSYIAPTQSCFLCHTCLSEKPKKPFRFCSSCNTGTRHAHSVVEHQECACAVMKMQSFAASLLNRFTAFANRTLVSFPFEPLPPSATPFGGALPMLASVTYGQVTCIVPPRHVTSHHPVLNVDTPLTFILFPASAASAVFAATFFGNSPTAPSLWHFGAG